MCVCSVGPVGRSVLEGVLSIRGSRGGGGFPGVWDAHAVQSSSPLDQSPSFVTVCVCNSYYYSMINNSIYYIEYRMNNDNNRKHNLIRWNLQIKQKHL